MHRVLFILGTRPEAIKLCPVIREFRSFYSDIIDSRICLTGQHSALLEGALAAFGVEPDYAPADEPAGAGGAQSLVGSAARILAGLEPVLEGFAPDLVLVQGDTTSALCGALAAFYTRTPVAHVEAGLRSGDLAGPYPEEMNRTLTAQLASLHFAPTETAARNLRREGVAAERILVTGNTAVDAVLHVAGELLGARPARPFWPWRDESKALILVTAHRRESFGPPLERIIGAVARLAGRGDAQIAFSVHPNPRAAAAARRLRGLPGVVLLDPPPYAEFVDLMLRSSFLLTDSGGLQEEGPALGKPVLVMRERTERGEAVSAGAARLVGTGTETIVAEASRLLDNPSELVRMAHAPNPYGDGRAAGRIAQAVAEFLAPARRAAAV